MPAPNLTDLLQTRLEQSAEMSQSWLKELAGIDTLRLGSASSPEYMADQLRQIVSILFNTKSNPEQARLIGADLARCWASHPLVLGRTIEFLSLVLLQDVSSDDARVLYPRLNTILAELAWGFSHQIPDNLVSISGLEALPHHRQPDDRTSNEVRNDTEFRLSRLKLRFSTLISHEFRTPMARIMSASDLLKHYGDRLPNNRKQELLESIETQIKDLDTLLNDVLLVATAQSFGMNFNPKLMRIDETCRRAINEVLAKVNALEDRVILSLEQLPSEISLDEELIHRIIFHLILNALTYSPPERPVRLTLTGTDHSLTIRVQDHGNGIAATDQNHIFDPFYRGDETGFIPGIGLGLTLVKYCVAAHHGSITIESDKSTGTMVTVLIPLR